jgi:hypothetical protein
MTTSATPDLAQELRILSQKLQELHARILRVEQRQNFAEQGFSLLDRLANDPAWAWLRAISALIADIDHALASEPALTENDRCAVAAHVRGVLFGEGDLRDEEFLFRYRQLLQMDAEIASMHGELRALLKGYPAEADSESERLHARHQWAQRRKHRTPGKARR